MAGNVFRWLAGGEFNATKAESVDEAVPPARTGPRPRLQKNVKKRDYTIRAEQLVDEEVVKTPYGDVTAKVGEWVVWFEGNAQVMSNDEYVRNFEEVK